MTKRMKVHAAIIGILFIIAAISTPSLAFAASEDNQQSQTGQHEEQVGHGAESTHGEAAHGNGHGFNWGQFIGKTINSIILFGGLIILLRKPIIKLLTQKSLEVKTDIQQREDELDKTDRQLENLQKRLEKIEEEIANMKHSAEDSGNEEKNRIEDLGNKEAQRIMDLANAEIDLKIENSIRNLKTKIADLTIDHFKNNIQQQLDKQSHKNIIDKNIQRCGEISERK